MTTPRTLRFRLATAVAALLALAGCAGAPTAAPAPDRPAATASDTAAPQARGDGSGPMLRCMDALLLDYGTRDLSIAVEPMADAGARSGAVAIDTQELLVDAASALARQSQSLRIGYAAGKVADAPPAGYVLRGVALRDARGQLAGVELRLLHAADRSVVPGVASSLQAGGGGRDVRRFGVSLPLPPGGDERATLRAFLEPALVETIGRLAHVPYWSCFGADPADAEVAAEVRDWYDAMAVRPNEIIGFFQSQLKLRGVYDGPLDGVVNAPIKDAVARYREALGLSREPKLSQDFMRAYLQANHREVASRLQPRNAQPPSAPATAVAQAAPSAAPPAATAPVGPSAPPAAALPVVPRADAPATPAAGAAPQPSPTALPVVSTAVATKPSPESPSPLTVKVGAVDDALRFDRGQVIQLGIKPSRDAHVYCFLLDEDRHISRFFPNRFQPDSKVRAADGLQLPGSMRFEISMNTKGVGETVSCFASERELLAGLPRELAARDFAPLPVTSLQQLRAAFERASGRDAALAQDSFEIRAR